MDGRNSKDVLKGILKQSKLPIAIDHTAIEQADLKTENMSLDTPEQGTKKTPPRTGMPSANTTINSSGTSVKDPHWFPNIWDCIPVSAAEYAKDNERELQRHMKGKK